VTRAQTSAGFPVADYAIFQPAGPPGHAGLRGEQGRAVAAAGQPAPDPVQLDRHLGRHRTGRPSPAAPGLD